MNQSYVKYLPNNADTYGSYDMTYVGLAIFGVALIMLSMSFLIELHITNKKQKFKKNLALKHQEKVVKAIEAYAKPVVDRANETIKVVNEYAESCKKSKDLYYDYSIKAVKDFGLKMDYYTQNAAILVTKDNINYLIDDFKNKMQADIKWNHAYTYVKILDTKKHSYIKSFRDHPKLYKGSESALLITFMVLTFIAAHMQLSPFNIEAEQILYRDTFKTFSTFMKSLNKQQLIYAFEVMKNSYYDIYTISEFPKLIMESRLLHTYTIHDETFYNSIKNDILIYSNELTKVNEVLRTLDLNTFGICQEIAHDDYQNIVLPMKYDNQSKFEIIQIDDLLTLDSKLNVHSIDNKKNTSGYVENLNILNNTSSSVNYAINQKFRTLGIENRLLKLCEIYDPNSDQNIEAKARVIDRMEYRKFQENKFVMK